MDIPSTCKVELSQDDFEQIPRWEAHLTNGLIVYSDDKYIHNKSDWARLSEYCKQENISIDKFCIGFRDHKVFLDKRAGYYFRRMRLTAFGGDGKEYYIVGSGEPPEITIYKYALPELILFESESRLVTKEDLL